MARSPFFYLRGDERALLTLRAAPAYALSLAVGPVLLASLLLAGALAARTLVPALARGPAALPWVVWAVLVAIVALASWRRAATTEYAVTDQRVYARAGRLVTRLHFTTHDKVTDIRYRQGPLERLLGIASLTFATAGGEVALVGVRDAERVKASAESARDAFIHELLREAPSAPASASAAAFAPQAEAAPEAPEWTGPRPAYLQAGETPVWYARPRRVAAAGALRSLAGVVALLLFTGFMPAPRRALVAAGALGLVLMLVAVRLMQLRRTEYVATPRRVYARSGLVGTTVSQLTYEKITDITLTQDALGRLLGYGSLVLQTAGGTQAPITMVGLADPLGAKEAIERWRDAAVGHPR